MKYIKIEFPGKLSCSMIMLIGQINDITVDLILYKCPQKHATPLEQCDPQFQLTPAIKEDEKI